MDPQLQKLIRQLQSEQCPPAVHARVAQQIARQQPRAHTLRATLAWSLSLATVTLIAAGALWQTHRANQQPAAAQIAAAEAVAAQTRAQHALVLLQTHQAFGYIGHALLRAAAHTENAISKEAVPSLRNSFEHVKNKVTNPI